MDSLQVALEFILAGETIWLAELAPGYWAIELLGRIGAVLGACMSLEVRPTPCAEAAVFPFAVVLAIFVEMTAFVVHDIIRKHNSNTARESTMKMILPSPKTVVVQAQRGVKIAYLNTRNAATGIFLSHPWR